MPAAAAVVLMRCERRKVRDLRARSSEITGQGLRAGVGSWLKHVNLQKPTQLVWSREKW